MTQNILFVEPYERDKGTGRDQAKPIIERGLSLPANSLSFAEEPNGKPLLAGIPGAHASISHSGSLLAVYIGCAPGGVDIERMKPRPNIEDIASLAFAPEEAKVLAEAGTNALVAFYELWTAREAGVKLEGQTLSDGIGARASNGFPRRYWIVNGSYLLCLSSTREVLDTIGIIAPEGITVLPFTGRPPHPGTRP